ncbi:MAG TPA: porin family protein, partial [Bacteroidales bacterium]|nr:porin family protein [Bacteroidales bacterium]
GIKVGTTISRFSSEQPHNNYKPGFTAGVFVNYPISGAFSVQLEPAYFQQGGDLISVHDYSVFLQDPAPFLLEVKDHKVTYNNIDAPLLVRYDRTIGGLDLFATLGPSFGFNLNTTASTDVSARSFSSITELPVYYDYYESNNISSNIKTMQYGITGGLGFQTAIGTHSLIFDVRYRYSINDTYPGYSYLGIFQTQGDLKSNSLYFTLGFGF